MPDPKRIADFVHIWRTTRSTSGCARRDRRGTWRKTTYVVERYSEPGDLLKVIYMLRGPRGEEYGLISNPKYPCYFSAVNARGRISTRTPFEGRWFTTKDDGLVLV